jgi:hypothetical protein
MNNPWPNLTDDEALELSEIYQHVSLGCDDWWDRKRGCELIAKKEGKKEEAK